MRHLIDSLDLSVEETQEILDLADRIAGDSAAYAHCADGKILATLFYEPSTRTRLSFETAMLNLGGRTLGFAGAEQCSATKGETVADTARWSAVMRTSSPCGIPRRVRRCGLPCIPGFR